jgi:hypothetical protein
MICRNYAFASSGQRLFSAAVMLTITLVLVACGGGDTPTAAPVGVAIVSHPTTTSAALGSTATFTVGATGTTPRYQWRKNGIDIDGATDASYTTPPATVDDYGALFSAVATNDVNTVVSGQAVLASGDVVPSAGPIEFDSGTQGNTVKFALTNVYFAGSFVGSGSQTSILPAFGVGLLTLCQKFNEFPTPDAVINYEITALPTFVSLLLFSEKPIKTYMSCSGSQAPAVFLRTSGTGRLQRQ